MDKATQELATVLKACEQCNRTFLENVPLLVDEGDDLTPEQTVAITSHLRDLHAAAHSDVH